ncbi:MAG TPA: flagellin [Ferrovibrio sp.]|uniref:flagellin n=1 Tax=Ferrovibrio sp. TaxID=1917215 RepID=UPI002B4AFB22|nr:flagellin [Ferrovibrio sp.]HLT76111.1 flagellin [Ferrovibrio sp.]
MVALVGSTQYALQLDVTRSIRLLNLELTRQNQQLGSGRIVDGLIGVSARALELGQLKSQLGTVENYKDAVQSVVNRVNIYAFTIEEIIDLATEAQDTMIKNRDPFFAATAAPRSQAETLLDRLGNLLQVRDGDRFLFGGANYTTNPINGQLSGLPTAYAAGAVPGAFTPVTSDADFPIAGYGARANFFLNNGPPFTAAVYDDFFNTASTTLYSDDGEQVSYGVSAGESGFQRLADALIRFRDATADVTAAPETYQLRIDDAREQLNTAITELKSIASRNGYKQQQLREIQERHNRSLDVLKTRIGSIENADIAEVSVNIKNLQTSLEASYVITRDSLQLSLVNFLR